MVRPSPSEAAITPNAPCTTIEHTDELTVCAFGSPRSEAKETVALVGDSHAMHWRAAVDVAARASGWRALSITHTACPFTKAVRLLREPRRSQCVRWTAEVIRWFRRHPEVHKVLVSAITSKKAVRAHPGQSRFGAEVDGYAKAWSALPATVQHLIVVRDTPKASDGTRSCVERAMTHREAAGPACALSRRRALPRDPEVVATTRLPSPRFRAVRLTEYICDTQLCYPVVGGALVYKDTHHITRVFSTTLGPFLLHKLQAVLTSRRALQSRLRRAPCQVSCW
jgi:hypothetical protein